MKTLRGGVTQPKGFQANGIACGIKKSGRPDLSLIVSDVPCTAAAVYTKNSVKAAPLIVTKKHLANGCARAVITNSGNANCFTGPQGVADAQETAQVIAHQLKINTRETAVSSTGIIGKPLPLTKIKKAVPVLVSGLGTSAAKGTAAAAAIMTTDTFVKETAVSLKIGGKTVTIGGCAKGSGMIEPNMATMLAYVTTDAAIDKRMLKQALADAVDRSFHCITVDGCMSTNDMTIVLANGLAGNRRITAKGQAFDVFCQALTAVCFDLAKKIVRDGEGAKKLLQVSISGAPTAATARRAAKAVANSNLVKTAAYGKNANWGRIAAAVGSLGLNITEDRLTIQTRMIGGRDVMIHADLGLGQAEATVLTCDLTEDYIKINGAYN